MKPYYLIHVMLLLCLNADTVFAYGSSSSSSSCHKPRFSKFTPAANQELQSFSEFSFVASSNTVAASIEVNISAGGIKHHFSAKELEIIPKNSGQLEIKGKLDTPYEQGFARISVSAHSKPECKQTDGYLVKVQ